MSLLSTVFVLMIVGFLASLSTDGPPLIYIKVVSRLVISSDIQEEEEEVRKKGVGDAIARPPAARQQGCAQEKETVRGRHRRCCCNHLLQTEVLKSGPQH